MSGTGDPDAAPVVEPVVAPVTTETPAVVTEVDIPADGGFPAPETAVAEPVQATEPPKVDEPKTIKKSPYQARIDTLVREREAEKAAAVEARREADLYKAMAEGKTVDAEGNPLPQPVAGLVPGSPEFKKAVRDEAVQIAASEAAKARTDKLLKAGNTEYKDFTDRCNVVASLGAGDRSDFMQIVTDPDVIADGSKVIALLAENPDEAARILALPTVQMTAALVKFEGENSKAPAPKPISAAPAPIKTIDGQSRSNDEPRDTDSMSEYARKYQAQQAAKLKDKQPSRFARH